MTVDVVQRMRTLVRHLLDYVAKKEEKEQETEALEALEELTEWTDDVNTSIDFMKASYFLLFSP